MRDRQIVRRTPYRRHACRGPRQPCALSRFELDVDGVTAVANYQLDGGVMTFTHTEVPPPARHGGIASQLIEGALEAARARGLKIAPRCSFVKAYVDKHSEVHDLLA
jgi:uncharacterized protein